MIKASLDPQIPCEYLGTLNLAGATVSEDGDWLGLGCG